jgi:cysteine synthase B
MPALLQPGGRAPSGLLGEDPRGIPNNLMPYVAKVAGGELPRLGVFGNDYDTPDGTGVRDYIHVMDLAQGHLAALDFLLRAAGWHAINLGTGQGYSVLQMVRAFESASGKPVPYDIKPRRAGDIGTCYANPAKAKALLGWEATRGLQEMCDSMWLWQSKAAVGWEATRGLQEMCDSMWLWQSKAALERCADRWCPGPESNRHALRRGILSPLRLPISPPGQGQEASRKLWHSDVHDQALNYPTIEDAIGKTPVAALQRIGAADNAQRGNVILGKLEGNNPAGSVKDRPALSMIQRAEERGDIKPGDTLIEATSGNTGIALAMAAAIKGYRMVLIMPEDLSIERAQTMKAFGAELMLTPKSGGMEYARDLAENMQREGKGRVLDQFANADNPRIHYETTGPELWEQTGGRITHFVSAMGTTGTITGVSRFLKEKNPAIQIIGAQPHEGSRIPASASGRRNTCPRSTTPSMWTSWPM